MSLASDLRAPPRNWPLPAALVHRARLARAQLLRWRPRLHAQRRRATPRVQPSGAASQLDPSRRPALGLDLSLDLAWGAEVHRRCPALFVMSGGSFNLDTHEDAAQEGGAHAPHTRGSLKPSILAPTWLARFETPSAHGRGGAPPSLTFRPQSAYTSDGFSLSRRS